MRQLYVHGILAGARNTILSEALAETVARLDPAAVSAEIAELVPAAGRQAVQAAGIRDEQVFALPVVLVARPSLLGYYRLLAGISQKQFYSSGAGTGLFKAMEESNRIAPRAADGLADLCRALNDALSELVTALPGGLRRADVEQLPLLMLGAQADGSWRTRIGQSATKSVFQGIRSIVEASGLEFADSADETSITLVNHAGRKITAALAADPDVVIREDIGAVSVLKVAIEIKGGTDQSNAHNRAGEAEKSHQKARASNAADFWTIISLDRVDRSVIVAESPTTRQWFDVTELVRQSGPNWDRFADAVKIAMGI